MTKRVFLIPLLILILLGIYFSWPLSSKKSEVLLPFGPFDSGKWCYINDQYAEIIPKRFEEAYAFHEGRAIVKENGKYGFIDPDGKLIVSFPVGSDVQAFSGGLAPVRQNGKWSYVDLQGKSAIPYQFDKVDGFSEGLAAVKVGNKWGFIDKSGEIKIPFKFEGADGFGEGLAAVRWKGKWGYIDRSGTSVVPFVFSGADRFQEGLAGVESKGVWGFIDPKGQWVIRPTFKSVYWFSEGLAAVSADKSWYYIDRSGKKIIPGPFEDAGDFSEGLAFAQIKDEEGYIDKTGKWIIPPAFDYAGSFSNGWAKVENGKREHYIDYTGRDIWDAAPIRFTARLGLYFFGLLLPGLAAHFYCRKKEADFLKVSKEEAREGYYRLGLKLNLFFIGYIIWLFAGLSIVGEMHRFDEVCRVIWNFESGWGLPSKAFQGIYSLSTFLLVFISYFSGMILIKTAPYRVDKILRGTTWSWGHYLWLIIRVQLTFLMPMILWVGLSPFVPQNPAAYFVCIFLYAFLFFVLSPLFIRFIWTSRPLDPSEMSERVRRLCEKAGLKVREVRVLEMKSGRIANAMVSGAFPFYRYIFFTDYLLANFTPEESETILAHEIGHIKKGHLWLNFLFAILWIMATQLIYKDAEVIFKAAGFSMIYFYLIWIFLYLGIITKFISRRFERQADEYCVKLTGELETYISALTKLTEINFSTKKWTGFDRLLKTHPDLEGRIKNLREMSL